MSPTTTLLPARIPADIPAVRRLFSEYVQGIGFDLAFQDVETELASLPGKYEPPGGRLLLAWKHGQAVGCVALRSLGDGRCEMKRLYVKPEVRGERLGARLAVRACDEARAAGYSRICLDTLVSMTAAVRLYQALGFQPIDPYVFNPLPGALFLGLELRPRRLPAETKRPGRRDRA